MTEKEAEYWDEYYTNNTVMPDLGKPGFFARRQGMMVELDPETTQFLTARAQATKKTPSQLIGEMVRERIDPYA